MGGQHLTLLSPNYFIRDTKKISLWLQDQITMRPNLGGLSKKIGVRYHSHILNIRTCDFNLNYTVNLPLTFFCCHWKSNNNDNFKFFKESLSAELKSE